MKEQCNEYYLTLLKENIINKICNNETAVKLINPETNDDLTIRDVLLGGEWNINGKEITETGHIFDYNSVNYSTNDARVFICVEAVPKTFNVFTVDVLLYVRIYVHKSLMKLTTESSLHPSAPSITEMNEAGLIGNRCDQLTQVIGKMLNGAVNIGGISEIKPYEKKYIRLDIPNNEFYGKCMIFKTKIGNMETAGFEDN